MGLASINNHPLFSQILVGGEEGFMLRYDYIDDATLEEWANWRKPENS